ncbi:protein FAM200C-like [Hydra vulgaris]|uniref:protein FAM200C-like n=1 Tax=Hydra vulgaris TaxID=6087 RepID=UPI0032EA70CC
MDKEDRETAIETGASVLLLGKFSDAQNKKAHTLAEEVIFPCTKEIVRLLFGEEAENKIDNISLLNTIVKRRLTDISLNIKEIVINEINTDEEFLFSSFLETTTKAAGIMELLKQFFNDNQLQWKYLLGITTDGVPAMMGCKSGLQIRVKEIAPNVVGVHCFIHRQALTTKTLLVRWLSAGNFLEIFFKLRNEVKKFLCQLKSKLVDYFEFDNFEITTTYLVGIVGHFNKLNLKLQNKNAIITHSNKLKAFIEKLKLYKTRTNNGNLIMFQTLNSAIGNNMFPKVIKTEIIFHLNNLINEFAISNSYTVLEILSRTFKHWALEMFYVLYCSYVRLHLEYCSSAWGPFSIENIKALEAV